MRADRFRPGGPGRQDILVRAPPLHGLADGVRVPSVEETRQHPVAPPGMGGIGREVAQRGKGFGMRVLATRRSAAPPPSFVDRQGTPDDLHAFLRESDVVVLCVPLTEETRGMIDAAELALLKPGSYLINIARGPVVDTDALVDALQSGRLAGAGLDVTDPEPLPAEHVLWTMDNVVVTPHVSSRSELTEDRRWALYIENMRRFGAGEPLLNVVDKEAGY